jgi:hypothetical protein
MEFLSFVKLRGPFFLSFVVILFLTFGNVYQNVAALIRHTPESTLNEYSREQCKHMPQVRSLD